MTTRLNPPVLYRIDECPDLLVDACLCDEQRQLIFLSLWGRDTAAQAFLARLTLGSDKDGLTGFHLQTEADASLPVEIGNVNLLQKRTTRALRRTLFGTLNHLWLFDGRCVEPDKPNAKALAILPKNSSNPQERLWRLVRETCPLPLLEHWRDAVLELLRAHSMLRALPLAVGPLIGFQLSLDVPVLTRALGDRIRAGVLGIAGDSAQPVLADVPLRLAA